MRQYLYGTINKILLVFKIMLIGLLVIIALGIGFIIIITSIIITPIIKWWKLQNIENDLGVVKTGDYIDVDYEVIKEKNETKTRVNSASTAFPV